MTAFGALLRCHRVRVGLSQNELARRAGCDAAHVHRLEKVGRIVPGRAIVLALALALDLDYPDTDRLLAAAGHASVIDWQTRAERAEARLVAIQRTLGEDDLAAEEAGAMWVVK